MNLRVEIVVKNAFPSIELKFSIIIRNGSIRKKKNEREGGSPFYSMLFDYKKDRQTKKNCIRRKKFHASKFVQSN